MTPVFRAVAVFFSSAVMASGLVQVEQFGMAQVAYRVTFCVAVRPLFRFLFLSIFYFFFTVPDD